MAKAFDTVPHDRLLQKLKKIGFGGAILRWIETYLKDRLYSVRINKILSEELSSEFGVPQGSVLGPIFFIIYINDMYALPLRAEILGYADDTSLIYRLQPNEMSKKAKNALQRDFQYDQKILFPWMKRNLLTLNIKKCECIIYSYKTPQWAKDFKLQTGEKAEDYIERVTSVKYLGVKIDEKLTWATQSLYVQEKVRKINYLFYVLKNYFTRKHLCYLYKSLYESVLSYGLIHWGSSKHLQPVKVLQNKVARTILSLDKRTSEGDIYPKLGAQKLENLYRTRVALFVFKNKIEFGIHDTVAYTRGKGGLQAAYHGWKKCHSRMQLAYRGCEVFNSLPLACRNTLVLSAFKRGVIDGVELV